MRAFRTIAAIGALLTATVAWGGTITGSAHDFTTASWSGGRICIACHAAHNTDTNIADAPLWSHKNSTIASYTLYSSPTFDGAGTMTQPSGSSKLCLSCHDGSVAVDSFGGKTGTSYVTTFIGKSGNLKGDHPIGFAYDAVLFGKDPSLADPSSTVTIGSGAQTKTGSIASVMLYNGKLECASCHDTHNTFTAAAPPGATSNKLIKITEVGSGICLACHKK